MENLDLQSKTIGKLYRAHEGLNETEVITVRTFVYKNETRIALQYSRFSDYYKKSKREKDYRILVIREDQFNDFVDLLRAALDQCAKYVENVQD